MPPRRVRRIDQRLIHHIMPRRGVLRSPDTRSCITLGYWTGVQTLPSGLRQLTAGSIPPGSFWYDLPPFLGDASVEAFERPPTLTCAS
jgi:hypothetical protein